MKDSFQHLKKSLESNENLIKNYDNQLQRGQEELNQQKAAVQECKDIIQQKKREQVESNQKFIKELEFYQSQIEKVSLFFPH